VNALPCLALAQDKEGDELVHLITLNYCWVWRHDILPDDTLPNGTQNNGTQHSGLNCKTENDPKHNETSVAHI